SLGFINKVKKVFRYPRHIHCGCDRKRSRTAAVRLAEARSEAAGAGERGPESPREPEPWEGGTSARAGALEGRAPVWARAVDRPDCPQALTGPLEDRLQIAAMSRSTSAWVAAAAVGPPPPPRTTLMPASSAMIAPPA